MFTNLQSLNRWISGRAAFPNCILSAFLVLAGSALFLLDGLLNPIRQHSSSRCPAEARAAITRLAQENSVSCFLADSGFLCFPQH